MSFTIDQIQALESEIAAKVRELESLRRESKSKAIEKVREIAQSANLTAEDVAGIFPSGEGKAAAKAAAPKKAKPAFKYYDEETKKGWSGASRGKVPEPFASIIKAHNGDRDAAAADLAKYLV